MTAYALAICFGLLASEQRAHAGARLAQLGAGRARLPVAAHPGPAEDPVRPLPPRQRF
ncbi:hypothetical protein ACQP2E_11940 [Actinoplanes sp. CA-015351]|uniref:hypothetical protein n=1 Tax=Actinoplanes sp. CA-015351 TaxID=3239897 RepID=UPI003D9810BE